MCEILTLISHLELFLFKIVSGQLMPDTTIYIYTYHIIPKSQLHFFTNYHFLSVRLRPSFK